MKLKRFLSCLLISLPTLTFAASSTSFTNVVTFGDSLVDTGNPYLAKDIGNNKWVQFCQKGGSFCSKNNPLYLLGAPVVNATDDFNDKRANWVNYFDADYANTQVLPYRLYQANPKDYRDLNTYNMDFAYASAESGNRYIDDLHADSVAQMALPYNPYRQSCTAPGTNSTGKNSCVPGVATQVNFYLDALKQSKIPPSSHTLYIFWSGGSDLFNNVGKLISLVGKKHIPSALSALIKMEVNCNLGNKNYISVKNQTFSCPVNNIVNNVKNLVNAKIGAAPANIVVMNMADLSKTPAVYQLTKGNKVALGLFSQLTNLFNKNLKSKLKNNGLAAVKVFDVKSLLNAIIADPQKYGFSPNNSINQAQQDCIASNKFKPTNCQGFVWFNSKHPSSHSGECIANSLNLFLAGKDPILNLQC